MGFDINTAVDLAGLKLKNPVMPASGTFGFGREFREIYDLNILGAMVTKSVTLNPRYGNELPRIAECESGMMNSVGLQNPGLEEALASEYPSLAAMYKGPIIANISGFNTDEFAAVAEAVGGLECVAALEVNISCPNVECGGAAFGQDIDMASAITSAVKGKTEKPVFVKLTPNVTDIASIALACEAAGADGISLVNTFKAMRIDIERRKTITAITYAGLSGPAIKPIALRMVNEVYKAVNIPVIGIGGIAKAEDVIEMIMAGATAVQIGAANLVNPIACMDIIADLPLLMDRLVIKDFDEIRGVV